MSTHDQALVALILSIVNSLLIIFGGWWSRRA